MSTLKRAVITGIGAISCIGNNISEITKSLKLGTSGISFNESYKELGMRSHISGSINLNLKDLIDRKHLRFMGEAASYAYLSTAEAIKDSGLDLSRFSSQDVGVIAGSGGASSRSQVEAADIVKSKGVKRIGPYRVTQTMGKYRFSSSCNFFWHQRGEFLYFLCMLNKRTLYWISSGTNSVGKTKNYISWWR